MPKMDFRDTMLVIENIGWVLIVVSLTALLALMLEIL